MIDVGSEWRTFSNEKGGEDRSRVGGPENTLLGSSDLTTMIGNLQRSKEREDRSRLEREGLDSV